MKNHSQISRLKFALVGLQKAWKEETSFRTEVFVIAGVFGWMAWKQVPLVWWLVMVTSAGIILIAELVNTAIENVCDAVHPEQHPGIGSAKDCASAAVLVANTFALIVLAILLWQTW